MAHILVMSDDGRATLLDERHVHPVRFEGEHESLCLIERIARAVADAAERDQQRERRNRRRRMKDTAVQSAVGRCFE